MNQPTPEAYEAACRALHKHRDRADALAEHMGWIRDRVYGFGLDADPAEVMAFRERLHVRACDAVNTDAKVRESAPADYRTPLDALRKELEEALARIEQMARQAIVSCELIERTQQQREQLTADLAAARAELAATTEALRNARKVIGDELIAEAKRYAQGNPRLADHFRSAAFFVMGGDPLTVTPAARAELDEATKGVRARLADHYLAQIVCDHERGLDNPICACSMVHLGWHPSVGAAVAAWIDHALAATPQPAPAAGDTTTGGELS